MEVNCVHGRPEGLFCPHCSNNDVQTRRFSGAEISSEGIIIDDPELRIGASVDATAKILRKNQEADKIIAKAANQTAEALKAVITRAKDGDRGALRKLEAFQIHSDPQLAARVALMNHDQRRAWRAARRGKNKSGRRG